MILGNDRQERIRVLKSHECGIHHVRRFVRQDSDQGARPTADWSSQQIRTLELDRFDDRCQSKKCVVSKNFHKEELRAVCGKAGEMSELIKSRIGQVC